MEAKELISRKTLLFWFLLFFSIAVVEGVSIRVPAQVKRKDQPSTERRVRDRGSLKSILSPAATLRAYYQAAINKDINTAKKYLSAGTLSVMEAGAKSMGKSLDAVLREGLKTNPTVMPSFSNERIRGATATVDINSQGAMTRMPMVKENGRWKLAMDKLIEETQSQILPKDIDIITTDSIYTEDEKHRLFQAVGITEDRKLILEVANKIGIADSYGQPKSNFQSFVDEHYIWAVKNVDFIRQHMDKVRARRYVMANK